MKKIIGIIGLALVSGCINYGPHCEPWEVWLPLPQSQNDRTHNEVPYGCFPMACSINSDCNGGVCIGEVCFAPNTSITDGGVDSSIGKPCVQDKDCAATPGATCNGGKCTPSCTKDASVCPSGTHCVVESTGGRCMQNTDGGVCAQGYTMCASTCVNLSNDVANCGACGKACGNGQSCSNGLCIAGTGGNCGGSCPNGQVCNTLTNQCVVGKPCLASSLSAPCGAGCYDINDTQFKGQIVCLWVPSDKGGGVVTPPACTANYDNDKTVDGKPLSAARGDCNDADNTQGFCWGTPAQIWNPPPLCNESGMTPRFQ